MLGANECEAAGGMSGKGFAPLLELRRRDAVLYRIWGKPAQPQAALQVGYGGRGKALHFHSGIPRGTMVSRKEVYLAFNAQRGTGYSRAFFWQYGPWKLSPQSCVLEILTPCV